MISTPDNSGTSELPERKKKIGEEIFEKMKQMIVSGQWRAGDRLPTERELMDMFSASRISVREPLKQLVSLGMVETRQGSGTFVRSFNETSFVAPMKAAYSKMLTKQDVLYILDVRKIEIMICSLAAEYSSEEDVETLRQIQHRLESGMFDPVIHQKTDLEFHLQICKMTRNPYLLQVCQLMFDALDQALTAIVPIMGPEKAIYYHKKLIDTIANHYVHEAERTMEEHLTTTIEAVRAMEEDSPVFAPSIKKSNLVGEE